MNFLRSWSKGSVPKCILAVLADFCVNIVVFTVLWRLYILIFGGSVPAALATWSLYIYIVPMMLVLSAMNMAIAKAGKKLRRGDSARAVSDI